MNSNIRPKRGLRSFYPTDKGPIDLYQLGHDGRIEYLQAQIAVDHLSKGLNTNEEWKKWAKERGAPNDEPGLIISKRLGGSGIDSINLFPKSPLLDKTSWAKDEEKAYKEAAVMQKWKKLKFFAKFEYPEDDSLRPSEVEYQYDLPSGNKLYGKVSNVPDTPPPPPPTEEKVVTSPGGEEEEEEGSEFEYEYEEEEEEEPEAPPPQVPPPPPPPTPKKEETPAKVDIPSKPEAHSRPAEPQPQSPPKKRSPTPPPVTKPVPPPVAKAEPKPTPATAPTPPIVPEKPAKSEPIPEKAAPASSSGKDKKDNIITNSGIFARSDLIEMLPIVGSCKLVADTVKALYHKDIQRSLWKGAQSSISLFADYHIIRAFSRHGQMLTNPITEEKLVSFAKEAEPHAIIFVVCKAGNQILSVVRRILSNKKRT